MQYNNVIYWYQLFNHQWARQRSRRRRWWWSKGRGKWRRRSVRRRRRGSGRRRSWRRRRGWRRRRSDCATLRSYVSALARCALAARARNAAKSKSSASSRDPPTRPLRPSSRRCMHSPSTSTKSTSSATMAPSSTSTTPSHGCPSKTTSSSSPATLKPKPLRNYSLKSSDSWDPNRKNYLKNLSKMYLKRQMKHLNQSPKQSLKQNRNHPTSIKLMNDSTTMTHPYICISSYSYVYHMCIPYVCTICVYHMCISYVCTICVYHMCIPYVCTICVYHMCISYVCTICVYLCVYPMCVPVCVPYVCTLYMCIPYVCTCVPYVCTIPIYHPYISSLYHSFSIPILILMTNYQKRKLSYDKKALPNNLQLPQQLSSKVSAVEYKRVKQAYFLESNAELQITRQSFARVVRSLGVVEKTVRLYEIFDEAETKTMTWRMFLQAYLYLRNQKGSYNELAKAVQALDHQYRGDWEQLYEDLAVMGDILSKKQIQYFREVVLKGQNTTQTLLLNTLLGYK